MVVFALGRPLDEPFVGRDAGRCDGGMGEQIDALLPTPGSTVQSTRSGGTRGQDLSRDRRRWSSFVTQALFGISAISGCLRAKLNHSRLGLAGVEDSVVAGSRRPFACGQFKVDLGRELEALSKIHPVWAVAYLIS